MHGLAEMVIGDCRLGLGCERKLNRTGFARGLNFLEGWATMSKTTDRFTPEVRELRFG